jgi:hypothetical protein
METSFIRNQDSRDVRSDPDEVFMSARQVPRVAGDGTSNDIIAAIVDFG